MSMDQRTVAACAAFLGRDEDDVEMLHEMAELLPALLAGIGLALRKKAPIDQAGAWVDAVRRGWGRRPFTSAELIAWMEQAATGLQREVEEATRALCQLTDGVGLTPPKLSAALRLLAPGHVDAVGQRRGSTVWQLRSLRG